MLKEINKRNVKIPNSFLKNRNILCLLKVNRRSVDNLKDCW